MADSKVSDLTSLTTTQSGDLVIIIDDPSGTPSSKKMTLKNFFGLVPANATFSANVTISGNNFTVTGSNAVFTSNVVIQALATISQLKVANSTILVAEQFTPASSTATTVKGMMWHDANYLYIATATDNIKRIALTTF